MPPWSQPANSSNRGHLDQRPQSRPAVPDRILEGDPADTPRRHRALSWLGHDPQQCEIMLFLHAPDVGPSQAVRNFRPAAPSPRGHPYRLPRDIGIATVIAISRSTRVRLAVVAVFATGSLRGATTSCSSRIGAPTAYGSRSSPALAPSSSRAPRSCGSPHRSSPRSRCHAW